LVVAQGCRDGSLTLGEIRALFGHETRVQTEAFLRERGAFWATPRRSWRKNLEAAPEAAEE